MSQKSSLRLLKEYSGKVPRICFDPVNLFSYALILIIRTEIACFSTESLADF